MKIAICDDDRTICNEIREIIGQYNSNYCIDLFYCGLDLLNTDKVYDIVFLDIEMNEIDGMRTAASLREKNNNEYIIFLTSHSEFMQEAFKVKAFRYLHKPIQQQGLIEALCTAEREILSNKKIVLNEKNKMQIIDIKNIIYFESYGDGTYIYTNNEIFESIKPLKYWGNIVEKECFFQVHKSFLISLRYVKNIGNSFVQMQYIKQTIPISRRKFPILKKTFLDYIKNNAEFL